jgi:hypothetical protein
MKQKILAVAIVLSLFSITFFATMDTSEKIDASYDSEILSFDAPYVEITRESTFLFGGAVNDYFSDIVTTSNGEFIAVGASGSRVYLDTGDWAGIYGMGGDDAIIVKFDQNGEIIWKNRFGGSGSDSFSAVTATSDGGFVAVGYSAEESFNKNDWIGITGRGGTDAIIVKFDQYGNVVWKNRFGGSNSDNFFSLTSTSDGGFVAVGRSLASSFGNGDLTGINGHGGEDAIIVKFNSSGNIVWKNRFGGSSDDVFFDVTSTSDGGFVAVGKSYANSFGTGDLTGINGWGGADAIIVKFNSSGNVVWKKRFGGSSSDEFRGITSTTDGGFVAVGTSISDSFGTGDLTGITGLGYEDAIIVKFDVLGNTVWKNRFGGLGSDTLLKVASTSDGGFVAVNYVETKSIGTGDWVGFEGKGGVDAGIVKFDASGNVVWKDLFGGSGYEIFNCVTAKKDGGFVAVGYSEAKSFNSGDWTGISGRGSNDAIVVEYIELDPMIEITSTPKELSLFADSQWSYEPETKAGGAIISVSGAAWLTSNGKKIFTDISGAPEPTDGKSEEFIVTVTAEKDGYRSGTQRFTLTIFAHVDSGGDPVPKIKVTPESGTPVSSYTYAFDGSGSSDLNPNMQWDFGDGKTGTGVTATNTYTHSGIFTVTLRITNSDGTGTAEEKLLIVDAQSITTATFGVPYYYTFNCSPGGVKPVLTGSPFLSVTDYGDDYVTVSGLPLSTEYVGKIYKMSLNAGGTTYDWSVTVSGGSGYPIPGFDITKIDGLKVTVTSTAINADYVYYKFFEGDIFNLSGATLTHPYTEYGTYTITQRVNATVHGQPVYETYSRTITLKEPVPEPIPDDEKGLMEKLAELFGWWIFLVITVLLIIMLAAAALGKSIKFTVPSSIVLFLIDAALFIWKVFLT